MKYFIYLLLFLIIFYLFNPWQGVSTEDNNDDSIILAIEE